jgi:N-glycosidase YbiA
MMYAFPEKKGNILPYLRLNINPDGLNEEDYFMKEVIKFYRVNEEYGFMSNFAPYSIKLKGKTWSTSEHYFQAQKFAGTEYESEIRKAKTPMIAATMGRDRSKPLRKDWESVKDSIMRDAVKAKFDQHSEIKQQLIGTGDAKIVEHTSNDSYWGDGGDGSGKNMLGKILMQVRDNYRNNSKTD